MTSTNNPIDKHVGSRIRSLRMQRKMSISQLASRVGLSDHEIERYEDGSIRVGADSLNRIAAALGEGLVSFFEGATHIRDIPINNEDIQLLPQSDETRELVRAFLLIENAETRRMLIDLAICFAAVPNRE